MRILTGLGLTVLLVVTKTASAGIVIVNHDEWTTTTTGFSQAPDTSMFVTNIASFVTGGSNGNFLAYSSNFSLNNVSIGGALTAAGHTYTIDATGATGFTAANLAAFDAVFVAGPIPGGGNLAELAAYVNGGGAVYLAGGTAGFGSSSAEANFWNPFLGNFGFAFSQNFNGIGPGTFAVTGTHAILNGVSSLYYNNGNTTSLTSLNPSAQIIEQLNGQGLIGVYDDRDSGVIPEPSTFVLVGVGLMVAGLARRRITRM